MIRVGITAPPDRISEIAGLVEDRGLEPIDLPCVVIEPAKARVLESVRRLAGGVDLVLITSARTVSLVWPHGIPGLAVAAVGASTSRAVAAAGGRVVVVGAEGAAKLVEKLDLTGLTILYPRAEGSDPATLEVVRDRARRLEERVVYRADPIAPPPQQVEAVMFGSPSAVDGWVRARPLEGLVVGAIGRTTAARLARHGRSPDVVPPRPGYRELVESLAEHMEVRT